MSAPATIVRRFYEALGRGDVSAALLLLDPHVEWTEAERYPYYGGTWQGRQAVLDNLLKRLRARRQAREVRYAHRHRQGARSDAELNVFPWLRNCAFGPASGYTLGPEERAIAARTWGSFQL